MVLQKRIKCTMGSNWRIIHVFLCLVFFTLTLLVISNLGWLPVRRAHPNIQIPNMFPPMIRNFQTRLETYVHESQPAPRNVSYTSTTHPMPKSTEEPQELPFIYDYVINEPNKCKDSVPFLILLITTERWKKEARQAIRQTWGKEDLLPGVKILRLFLLGKDKGWTDDAKKSLREESQAYHDILQQDYLDTYNNLTIKVLMGLNWVTTHCPEASYIMKTDCDMFINTEYLINGLLRPDQPPKLDYFTGYLMINHRPFRNTRSKWYVSPEEYPEDKYPWFCSGTGYVFSAGLARKIVQVSPLVRWLHLEDVYVGLCLEQLGLKPVAPPKGTDFNIGRIPYTDCTYNQIVTSHGFSPGDIVSHWNQLQGNKHACVSHTPSPS